MREGRWLVCELLILIVIVKCDGDVSESTGNVNH